MRQITKIIVHCSATPEGKDFTVADITRWHKQRKFVTIGYHYVIYRNGEVHNGKPESQIGAHSTGHNVNSIGVCYIGGVAKDGKTPKDTRTSAQKLVLERFLIGTADAPFPLIQQNTILSSNAGENTITELIVNYTSQIPLIKTQY